MVAPNVAGDGKNRMHEQPQDDGPYFRVFTGIALVAALILRKTLAILRRVWQAYFRFHAGVAGYDPATFDPSTRDRHRVSWRVALRAGLSDYIKTILWAVVGVIVFLLIGLVVQVLTKVVGTTAG